MKKIKRPGALILISLLCFANPSFNMIDIFPDFIACFLLWRLIGEAENIVPYLAEARAALKKLGIVTLLRIPAAIVMYLNMYTGRDIVPLFTLVFSALELIFLFGAISCGFSALFYLGERTEAVSLISPFRVLGIRLRPESLRGISFIFVGARAFLNFLPQLCHLTFSDPKIKTLARVLYAPLEIGCMLAVLLLGLIFLLIWRAYARAVLREGRLYESILNMAGEEKLRELSVQSAARAKISSLGAVFFSMLLFFDIALRSTDGLNALPHFLFGIFFFFSTRALVEGRAARILSGAGAILYSVFGCMTWIFSRSFLDEYSISDIVDRGAAAEAYSRVMTASVLELVAFLLFLVGVTLGLSSFIYNNTGTPRDSAGYTISSAKEHKRTHRSMYIFIAGLLAVASLKCIYTLLLGNPEIIYSDTGMIVTTPLPWLNTLIFVLTAILFLYTYHFTSNLRDEVRIRFGVKR